MLTCWKIELCTVNQSWDMDILKCNKYCILCSIGLIHIKTEIYKITLKLLYMIEYLLSNETKWDVNMLKFQLFTHNQSWDMDILKCNKLCILCSIALIHVKIKIWKNCYKIVVHHWLFVV